jgi:hypothetical protein
MVCGLATEELEVLNILYTHHSVRSNRSFDFEHVAKAFRARFNKNPEDVAGDLRRKNYITLIPKRVNKYYISNIEASCYALNQHGYDATEGRILPHTNTSAVKLS